MVRVAGYTKRAVREVWGESWAVTRLTLYRMEERQWIKGRWVEKPGQRERCCYKLTPEGRKILARQRDTWHAFVARSTDGGLSWAPNIKLNDRAIDRRFGPSTQGGIRGPLGLASLDVRVAQHSAREEQRGAHQPERRVDLVGDGRRQHRALLVVRQIDAPDDGGPQAAVADDGSQRPGGDHLHVAPADLGVQDLLQVLGGDPLDGLQRANADVGMGDYVTVRPAEVRPARRITIAPILILAGLVVWMFIVTIVFSLLYLVAFPGPD